MQSKGTRRDPGSSGVRTINPAKNLTLRNRLNTQQEQEQKENAINGPVWLGRNRERDGDFSSVTQGLQHRQEQKLP